MEVYLVVLVMATTRKKVVNFFEEKSALQKNPGYAYGTSDVMITTEARCGVVS